MKRESIHLHKPWSKERLIINYTRAVQESEEKKGDEPRGETSPPNRGATRPTGADPSRFRIPEQPDPNQLSKRGWRKGQEAEGRTGAPQRVSYLVEHPRNVLIEALGREETGDGKRRFGGDALVTFQK